MTEKVRFKRQFGTLGKAAAVYVPPAKRRQLQLEREEAERKKNELQQSVAKVEDEVLNGKGPSGNGVSSSPADHEDGAITTETDPQEQLQQQINKQKETWQEQRRVINGTVNRLNATTIKPLIQELFQKVNLVRLRGPLCKSVLSAAVSSPKYSDVYAAIISVVNSKLPEVGELMVKRAILAFRRYYKQRDKASCQAVCVYIVHLFHQGIVHELIVLQLLSVLLDGTRPTDDSVEVAVHVLEIAGQALLERSSAGVRACTERMRSLLHEGHLNQRVEYRVEELLKARKDGFAAFPSLNDELDLVEEDDQITFDTSLDDEDIQKEEELDVYSFDPEYEEHEEEWKAIRAEILGLGDSSDDDSDDSDSDSDDNSDSSEDDSQEEASASGENALAATSDGGEKQVAVVEDLTEADLINLRRTIYLTIMSSATFEECAHKLARIKIPEGRESELINMLIECCSQERTFLRYYGLIASRFCLMDNRWKDAFMESFVEQYNTIHRLETNKLRNVAKLFAHLLHTDSIPWSVMNIIHLNEDETTSSSRIFIKIVIQEIAEAMGIAKLKQRFETEDEEHKLWYAGMFPKDNVRNTRYAINFFTSIGLGPLTDDLREFLKNAPKLILAKAKEAALAKKDEDSDDESSVVSSTSSSSFSSSSSDSTSSYSSYTSSSRGSFSSDSSSGSYSRRRSRGRTSRRKRSSRGRRRYSSDSSNSSDSRSNHRRGRRRSHSRSPPKVITKEKFRDDRSRSISKSRSPSSSLSRTRKKGERRKGRNRSQSPPKVISSKRDRDHKRSNSRSPPREGRRSNGRGGGRSDYSPSQPSKGSTRSNGGRGTKDYRSRSRSPRRFSSRSPPRSRGSRRSPPRKRGNRDRSPDGSSSRSPPRDEGSRRISPRGRKSERHLYPDASPRRNSRGSSPRERGRENNREKRNRNESRSRSRDRGRSPPQTIAAKMEPSKKHRENRRSESRSSSRSRSARNRSRSRSRNNSPRTGSANRQKQSSKGSHKQERGRSSSFSQSSSSGASYSSDDSRRRNARRYQSSRKSSRKSSSSSRSRSGSPRRSTVRKARSQSQSPPPKTSRRNRSNSRSPTR